MASFYGDESFPFEVVEALRRLGHDVLIRRFAACINNEGYEASLERNKIYRVKADPDAAKDGDIRVVEGVLSPVHGERSSTCRMSDRQAAPTHSTLVDDEELHLLASSMVSSSARLAA